MTRLLMAIAALFLLFAPLGGAEAHTTLRSSSPTSGSVLTQSPPEFSLTFAEPVRLTSLVLVTATGERSLRFTPSGSSATYTSARPGFSPGRNEIRWTALSQDGHVMEVSVLIVMRAPAR